MFFSEDHKRCYTYIIKKFKAGESACYGLVEDFVNCGEAERHEIPVFETIGNGYIQFDINFSEFEG